MPNKTQSPLVESVLTLDSHLQDLQRLGAKIESLEMQSDFDFEQAQKHIELFSKTGESVGQEIGMLAQAFAEAREGAELIASQVAAKAEKLQARKLEVQAKMEELRVLGESVRDLSVVLGSFVKPSAESTPEERAEWTVRLQNIDVRIQPLIEKAQALRKDAQESRMKVLEQSADSLGQSLSAISKKLSLIKPEGQLSH